MEREQSLASQQGAMAGAMTRACWGNSSVNSSTWIISSFLLVIFKVMVDKIQMKELIHRAGLCVLILAFGWSSQLFQCLGASHQNVFTALSPCLWARQLARWHQSCPCWGWCPCHQSRGGLSCRAATGLLCCWKVLLVLCRMQSLA